jgi:hypothetical protein
LDIILSKLASIEAMTDITEIIVAISAFFLALFESAIAASAIYM